jgi:hypothetical protein
VTNAVGSVRSSDALLTVHVPQHVGVPLLQPDGSFVINSQDIDQTFFAASAAGLQMQYSSNLVDWWPVLSPISISNGLLQFNDADATNASTRFYRTVEQW